jgi:hypothetical protein
MTSFVITGNESLSFLALGRAFMFLYTEQALREPSQEYAARMMGEMNAVAFASCLLSAHVFSPVIAAVALEVLISLSLPHSNLAKLRTCGVPGEESRRLLYRHELRFALLEPSSPPTDAAVISLLLYIEIPSLASSGCRLIASLCRDAVIAANLGEGNACECLKKVFSLQN